MTASQQNKEEQEQNGRIKETRAIWKFMTTFGLNGEIGMNDWKCGTCNSHKR